MTVLSEPAVTALYAAGYSGLYVRVEMRGLL